jgi:pimeloyl-ACP methyl ester carboxylesterase
VSGGFPARRRGIIRTVSDTAQRGIRPGLCSQIELSDGRSLDVWQAGPPDAEPLVFHHGTPGAGLPFDLHVQAMAERGLRYVAWTRPGYGSSTRRPGRSVGGDADDAQAVLDHLGIDRLWAVGWSGGGPHALGLAARAPERVRGVAIIGGVAPWRAEGLDFLAGMGAENVEEFGATLKGEAAILPYLERAWPTFRDAKPDEVATALGDLVDDVDRGAIAGGLAEWLSSLGYEALRESFWGWLDDDLVFVRPWGFDLDAIRCPVHVWQGAHDRMVPFAHGRWLAGDVPTAGPHLFDDHGHLSLVVDSFGEILDELLAAGG